MKKISVVFISLLCLLLLATSCTKQVPPSSKYFSQKLDVSFVDGRFEVRGSFESTGADAEEYTVVCTNVKDGAAPVEIKKSFAIADGVNSFEMTVPVTAKLQSLSVSVKAGNEEIVSSQEKTVKSFRLLSVGNSFSVDAQQYLYGIAKDMGYDNVILGNLYIGGCSLQGHFSTYVNERNTYIYYKNTTGVWTEKENATFMDGLLDEKWDYITLQQASGSSGDGSTYEPYLEELIKAIKVNRTNPNSEIIWHMTWAYSGDSTHQDFQKYDNDQMTMYEGIVNAVKENVVDNTDIAFILPAGTAIQNARNTSLGDTLCRDGFHLDLNYGRYLAGLTWMHKISGQSIDDVTYIPENTFDEATLEILKSCAKNAVLKPFEITQSAYTENPNGEVNLDDYVLIDWEPENSSYYNSTGSSTQKTGDSIAARFISSKIFSKDELPVGTIIEVDTGYQYRPEGWVDLNTKNTVRPDNVKTQRVVIDEAWWGEYNYRAFNLSKTNLSDICTDFEESITHFRIYVPSN